MRIEYDPARDLLHLYFSSSEVRASETITVAPGVHADFGKDGRLVGIEVIDASEIMGEEIEFKLPVTMAATAKRDE